MKLVEIMALIVACAVIIKLVVAILTTLLSMVLAVAALVFLLKELTIVQIFASLLFLTPLIVLGLVPFAGELLKLEDKILKDRNACQQLESA